MQDEKLREKKKKKKKERWKQQAWAAELGEIATKDRRHSVCQETHFRNACQRTRRFLFGGQTTAQVCLVFQLEHAVGIQHPGTRTNGPARPERGCHGSGGIRGVGASRDNPGSNRV